MSPAGGGGDRHHPEVPAAHWALKVGAARAQRDTAGGVGFHLCRRQQGTHPLQPGLPLGLAARRRSRQVGPQA